MPARRVFPLLLLLAACGGADPAAAPASPSPSPSATTSAGALLLAVSTPQGLSLHALDPRTNEAQRLHDLIGPSGFVVQSASLSAGTSPTTCAVWRPTAGTEESQLHCYAPGADEG